MVAKLDRATLERWRQQPALFIEEVLYDPATRQPFVLLPAERTFIEHAFTLREDGKLLYTEWLYSCPKKSGKTTFAALVTLTVVLLFGDAFPEATLAANDLDQAVGRCFEQVKRITLASPLLKREARILQDRILFESWDAVITAIPASFAGASGGAQNLAVFDEAWAYVSERSRRLWDELVPPPTRRIAARLCVTYAGFEGESLLLQELRSRGLAQPLVGKDLYAGDGLLMFWSHEPIAPWQDAQWVESMRRERPSAYQRMVLNEFAAAEGKFVDMSTYDACEQPGLTPVLQDPDLRVYAAVDASTKRDSTALVACTYDKRAGVARLVNHKIFTPTPGDPIDFAAVEAVLLDWQKRYLLKKVYFDPFQLVSVMQRMEKEHIKVEPYAQTLPNLTAATQNLFDLLQSRSIALYPCPEMRLAVSRAIIVESSRGWRLDKLKQAHKIDVVVALSMAALAAVRGQSDSDYCPWGPAWWFDDKPPEPESEREERVKRLVALMAEGKPLPF